MKNYSPLDAHIDEIYYLASEKRATLTDIAKLMDSKYGIDTTRKSIKRALDRLERSGGTIVTSPESELILDPIEWGQGRAKLVDNITTTGDTEVVVFISDIHVPYQDIGLLESSIDMIRELQPDRVVINGDVADFFQLSHFNTTRSRIDELQSDIDLGNDVRRRIREAAPNAILDETEGNHDNRLTTYIERNAAALKSLRALKPEKMFLYDELEINWHPGCGFLLRPHFLVKHGTFVSDTPGGSAKKELTRAGISGISGHVHRLQTYRISGYSYRQWTEQGGLMRLDADYVKGGVPNWQQGICIGEFSVSTDSFVVHEIPVFQGKLANLHNLFDRSAPEVRENVLYAV